MQTADYMVKYKFRPDVNYIIDAYSNTDNGDIG